MQTLTEITYRRMFAQARMGEIIIRNLLYRWVSEFEPAVVYHNGVIIGLGVVGDPTGTVHIHVWDLYPTW